MIRWAFVACLSWGSLTVLAQPMDDQALGLHYDFSTSVADVVKDLSGHGRDAVLRSGAAVREAFGRPVLDLGASNGYVDMPASVGTLVASLTDFSISAFLYIDPTTDVSASGNFVWTFSSSDRCTATTGRYVAYRVNAQQYEQSLSGWNHETVVVAQGSPAVKGRWTHVCYVQSAGTGTLYLDGRAVRSRPAPNRPADLGEPTAYNWLGRPAFPGDRYLKNTLMADFRIYTKSLNSQDIADLYQTLSPLRKAASRMALHAAADAFRPSVTEDIVDDLRLPQAMAGNVAIRWTSSRPECIDRYGFVVRPSKGTSASEVTLTACFCCDDDSVVKMFKLRVLPMDGKSKDKAHAVRSNKKSYAADRPYSAYLFAYFTGNDGDQEAIRFALSRDGLTYRALNGNRPVIGSDSIALTHGVRDPHILRGPDGRFYMVVTDMKAANGWDSNHGMVFLRSDDLIHWTHATVDIAALYPRFGALNRVWAPQTIWDPQARRFMVYWSQRAGRDPDVIHYAYVNDDFTGLATEPKVLFPYPTSTIDGDIVEKDGRYHLFFKTEGHGNGIKRAESASLTGPYAVTDDHYLQQTTQAVEGACVFKLLRSDRYVLMYDVYANGRYEFTSSEDLKHFKVLDGVSMNFAPRHGTVIPITEAEAKRLAEHWGESSEMSRVAAASAQVKKLNVVADEAASTLFLPVKPGTKLSSFDPGLSSLPGVTVQPSGRQDFSRGPVQYRLQLRDSIRNVSVSAAVHRNPVLDGYYADPDILYSEQTGRYYLYPTSDGFPGWSGTYFKCFSSADLETWKDEGEILRLGKDVAWSETNAWAPCIVERKEGDHYRYYYYFCAKARIGVAVSDSPSGPFVDTGRPLVDFKPEGVRGGQEIDPDVFTDPVSGKSYFYWGNGYMAGAELNDDMVSLKKETLKVLTPDRTFREGVYVIYRNGLYYFMWSEDDTGSPNYKVRYATSKTPLGPLDIPRDNIVIRRDDAQAIYGTGHHSVLQLPGRDEWYIVYHRLTRPKGIALPSPGFYREVCIDRLEFNADGSIRETKPTLEGVGPVQTRRPAGK